MIDRKIKFRAWNFDKNRMYFSKSVDENGNWCVDTDYANNCEIHSNHKLVQMQSTGWKDIHNDEGYHKDIVRFIADGEMHYGVIEWHCYGWAIFSTYPDNTGTPEPYIDLYGFQRQHPEADIVANIFINPELLTG
jgi:hypothetical protein